MSRDRDINGKEKGERVAVENSGDHGMCLEFPMNPHLLNNKEVNNNVVNIMTGGNNNRDVENNKKSPGYEVNIFFC